MQNHWQHRRGYATSKRKASSAAIAHVDPPQEIPPEVVSAKAPSAKTPRRRAQPSAGSPNARMAKLSALHARLSLPSRLSMQTLARCLIHASAEPQPGHNNSSMAILGQDLLAYYTAEHIMVQYPRLPMAIIYAAQYAYSGPATLSAMTKEWGIEIAAFPGPEVDPALLQYTQALDDEASSLAKDTPSTNKYKVGRKGEMWRRSMSNRVIYDDEFGDVKTEDDHVQSSALLSTPASGGAAGGAKSGRRDDVVPATASGQESAPGLTGVTNEAARASFIRALTGALYLHAGSEAVKTFHRDHILSRHLEIHKLFNFPFPTRDVRRLCAREDFEPPVARLVSETGRHSRTPVFVVGVYSGQDKLGEGAGASLDEARVRAAAATLRGWYLYSPPKDDIMRPSEVEGQGAKSKQYKPQMVDIGEIIS